ncbi:hypothetical protein EXT64_23120 [Pectobacterium atrosepticum]|uniref:Conidiation-specific protein 6 n=1 Tax=Coprinopsis cinerea (strain Okayama-7 / 130 / ATCC MYA-4618 / FGSC 9003) TaxID=240176 RepID=A8NUI3_COPC7|nr:hypothetical protein CC1G_07112 [Coprinopsis cinerea okayama7\|eukprot:XP_001836465.1 hypothetical protein CC1G_07112 [Coprinopsis cinerea okayama7\
MSGSRTHTKNPERVASGLKATIHNPNVSEGAKQRARDRLSELNIDPEAPRSAQKAADTEVASSVSPLSSESPAPVSRGTKNRYTSLVEEYVEEDEEELVGTPVAGTHVVEEEELEDSFSNAGSRVGSQAPREITPIEDTETGHRVLGGYKATMHNPRVSEKAKDHAKRILEEYDAL